MKKTFVVTRAGGGEITIEAERADVRDGFMSFTSYDDGTVFLIRAELVETVDVVATSKRLGVYILDAR